MRKKIKCVLCALLMLLMPWAALADETQPDAIKKVNWEQRGGSRAIGLASDQKSLIAVGFADHYINVYDLSGVFQYGLVINFPGEYVLGFDEQGRLTVISDKLDTRYVMEEDGSFAQFPDPEQSALDSLYNQFKGYTSLRVGEDEFQLRDALGFRWFSLFSHTKLVKKCANGSTQVIYDGTWEYLVGIFWGVTGVLAGAALLSIIMFYRSFQKRKPEKSPVQHTMEN
jgi:hypothetical protein